MARFGRCGAQVGAAVFAVMASQAGAEEGLWSRDRLTGAWGGARTAFEDRGIDIGANYTGEAFGTLSGGQRRGTSFEGRFDLTVEGDLDKLVGWRGARSHIRAFQIHNANNRNAADFVGSLADPSNIDALPTTRLFTAWLEQDFGAAGSLRVGQLAADDEFLVSPTAGGLINGTFGWATIMSANLPSGGAAYPLATPGARLQVNVSDSLSVLGAAFSGDPAGRRCHDADPQICNRHGTTFSFSGGTFWIAEAQYQVNQEAESTGLAAAYKVGAWYHSGRFADQRFGIDASGGAVTLALGPDDPLTHRGNWGVYGIIDQMVWRGPRASVSLFARAGLAPSDRNPLSWYADGGVGIKGLVPGRADDTLTFGIAHSHVSADASDLDRDMLALNGPPQPIRSGETVFELSYTLQLAPWWSLQPDIQYIVRPGGNVPDPSNPARAVGDALVIGLRTNVVF